MQTALQVLGLLQTSVVCALESLHCVLEEQAGVMQTLLQIIFGRMQEDPLSCSSYGPMSQLLPLTLGFPSRSLKKSKSGKVIIGSSGLMSVPALTAGLPAIGLYAESKINAVFV